MSFETDRGFAPQDYESFLVPIKVFIKHRLSKYKQRRENIIGFSSRAWNQNTYKQRKALMDYQDDLLNPITIDDPSAGLWYSLKWYLNLMG